MAVDTAVAPAEADARGISDGVTGRDGASTEVVAGGPGNGGQGLTLVGVGPVMAAATRVAGGVTHLSTGQGTPNGPLPTSRGGPDNFAFLQRSVTGDFEMTARLLSFEGTCEVAKMGLMMRASLAPFAVYTSYTFFKTAVGTRLQQNYRAVAETGNAVPPRDTKLVPVPLPLWMRLRRHGQSFSTWRSSDGVNWVRAFEMTVAVPPTHHVGLFSGSAGATCEVVFDSISIDPVRQR